MYCTVTHCTAKNKQITKKKLPFTQFITVTGTLHIGWRLHKAGLHGLISTWAGLSEVSFLFALTGLKST